MRPINNPLVGQADARPSSKRGTSEASELSKGWEFRRLGACLLSPPDYGINAPAVPHSSTLPTYLRITDIDSSGRFSPAERVSVDTCQSEAYFLQEGDIVLARTGASVGKSYLYNDQDGPLVFAGYLIRVRPDPSQLLPKFLSALTFTNRYWAWIRRTSMRSGQPGVNSREFATLQVPVPPVEEQRGITEALGDVDSLIGGLERLIAKKRDIKQGAMQQLLTGQTRLPGFTGKWETKSLGDLFSFSGGLPASRADLSSSGLLYLHYGDIHMSRRTFIDADTDGPDIPRLDIPFNTAPSSSLLADGDVVFVDASEDDEGISKHVVIANPRNQPFISGLHTIVAKSRTTILENLFKRHCFQSEAVRSQFRFFSAGTKVKGISRANISNISINVPPRSEQSAIASVLSDMDAEIEALEARLEKTRAVKQGMMQELLTGRIRLV